LLIRTIDGLSSLDLIIQRCPCGELSIHGFPHELRWRESQVDGTVTPIVRCNACGVAFPRAWRVVEDPDVENQKRPIEIVA
jgi:hypothetical protein